MADAASGSTAVQVPSSAEDPSPGDVARLQVDAALAEEFRQVGPHWSPSATASFEQCVACIHALPASRRPTALCLSGGGIRSATFSLGVLQAFAASGRLRCFDYLSTVSGGGYIGSWLTAWLRREGGQFDKVEAGLADSLRATTRPVRRSSGRSQTADDPVARLRAYSNFLSPVWGLSADTLALAAIFLRNLGLNLLVWLPLVAAAVVLPRLFIAVLVLRLESGWSLAATVVALLCVIVGVTYTVADLPPPRRDKDDQPLPPPPALTDHFGRACFLPLLVAAVCFAMAGAWGSDLRGAPAWYFMLGGVLVHLLGIALGIVVRNKRGLALRDASNSAVGALLVLLIGAVGGGLLWLALQTSIGSSLVEGVEQAGVDAVTYATFSVPVLLGCYWVALSLYAGMTRRQTGEDEREWWSRATGRWLLASLGWLLLFGLTVQLPLWLLERFGAALPDNTELGLAGSLLGLATALAGYWSKNGKTLRRRAGSLVKATGMRLLDLMALLTLVMLLLVMSLAASAAVERCHRWQPLALPSLGPTLCRHDLAAESAFFREQALMLGPPAASATPRINPQARAFDHLLNKADIRGLLAAVLVMVGVSLLVSFAIGANAFSLHGMYGNRLVRAYLGATRARRRPHWFSGFDPDDNLQFGVRVAPSGDGEGLVRPFHVINVALNLVKPSDRRLAWQQRKAASFTVTPLRSGAEGLGYVPSADYGGSRGMSLGRAMTMSGAAASPNMGYHSSTPVTLVMALFNLRLGWWLPNPGRTARRWKDDEPGLSFAALLSEAFGRTTDDQASIYLSDGGHFENLGLYEMVRRRCHRIVVVDATCDPKFAYADLLDAVRKIRVDFGIPIELPAVLPGPDRNTPHARLVVGRIRYAARDSGSNVEDGWLYLIKPRLTGKEPPELGHYAANGGAGDSPFPHQSTGDQFFDETQFESYRLLGLVSAEDCFPEGGPDCTAMHWPTEPPKDPLQTGRPVVAATAAPGTETADRGVPAGPGLLDGLQQLGAGTALAAALTVGGTLGVAGVVTLAPTELRLSAEDRSLLRDGLQLRAPPADPAKDTAELRQLARAAAGVVTELQSAASRLLDAGARIEAAAGQLRGPALPELAPALTALAQATQALSQQLKTPLRLEADARLVQISTQIQQLEARLDKLAPQNNLALAKALDEARAALDALRAAVESGNPRRNVRGQDGGGR